MGFLGYPRPDGRAGIRNYVAVISTVVCANGVVEAIARAVPGVKPITHTEGCGRGPQDFLLAVRTLIGLGKNPNVAAVLVVGLGCEFITKEILLAGIGEAKKPVEAIAIQEEGGSRQAAAKGIAIARRLWEEAAGRERAECPWDRLTLGLECGGSDALSGVTANPLVGYAADWIVGAGGTAMLSETTEMIGTEKILARRAATPQVAKAVTDLITGQHRLAREILGTLADQAISPGNMDGGLSSIREKSLGCIIKGGSTPIRQVLDTSEPPAQKGLVIMDSPGSDIFSLTAMAAGGAQLMLFTTGRGTPAGFPLAPVIKIATHHELYRRLADDMDFDAGILLDGISLDEAGRDLLALIERVAAGEWTKAEINRNDLLAIHTRGPSF